MTVEGRKVSLHLVYFTDKLYASILDSHTFAGNIDSAAQLEKLAVIYQVLRNTARMLRDWYANIHTGTLLPQVPFLYPQPSGIAHHVSAPSATPQNFKTSCDILSLNLTFVDKVNPDSNALRVLYKGIMIRDGELPTRVYIKFVGQHYGRRPHKLLAASNLAPALYFCGEVLWGVKMIVMQDLDGDSLPEVYPRSYVPVIQRDIGAAKAILHDSDLVHGDIRRPNVVYVPNNGGDSARAYLIDFDWSGKLLSAKYPAFLNEDVVWPEPPDNLVGQYIKKEHDNFMFNRLLLDTSPRAAKRQKSGGDTQAGSSGNPGNASTR